MLRGEEERGSMDVLLSQPRGRGRVALEKLAVMWVALLLMGFVIVLPTFAGGKSTKADFGFGDSLLFALNVVLACGVFGAIALFLSQFTLERGTASGITGGLLVLFIALDIVHRVTPNAEWISRLSPIYYYNESKPLIPSYGTNAGAMLIMLALSVLLSGAAVWFFVRREYRLPVNAWSLRSVYTRSLRVIVVPTCWWTLGIAGFAGFMVFTVKQIETQMTNLYASSPLLKNEISKVGGGDMNTNATILSFLFVFLPVLIMAFAVTQASRWSDGVLRLSAFYYYGTPLLHGLPLGNMLGILAVAVVALVLASARFVYKDIGR
jgi:ABC-2 type transport system permease protein